MSMDTFGRNNKYPSETDLISTSLSCPAHCVVWCGMLHGIVLVIRIITVTTPRGFLAAQIFIRVKSWSNMGNSRTWMGHSEISTPATSDLPTAQLRFDLTKQCYGRLDGQIQIHLSSVSWHTVNRALSLVKIFFYCFLIGWIFHHTEDSI